MEKKEEGFRIIVLGEESEDVYNIIIPDDGEFDEIQLYGNEFSTKEKFLNAMKEYLTKDETCNILENGIKEEWKNDPKFMEEILSYYPMAIKCIGEELKNDLEFMDWAICEMEEEERFDGILSVGDKLRNSPEFQMLSVLRGWSKIKDAPQEIWNNKQLFNKFYKDINENVLKRAESEITDDADLMLKIIEAQLNNIDEIDNVIKYASRRLRADKDFMSKASKIEYYNFTYADRKLRSDEEFILSLVDKDKEQLPKYMGKSKKTWINTTDLEKGKAASVLKYIHPKLKTDINFIKKAVKQNVLALDYINTEMLLEKDIVKIAIVKAVKEEEARKYMSTKTKKNKEFSRRMREEIEELVKAGVLARTPSDDDGSEDIQR